MPTMPTTPICPQRSQSDPTFSRSSSDSTDGLHRICIWYQDEELRLRSQLNAKQLIITATSPTNTASSSNSALLAKKALKYRKLLDRIEDLNVNDPAFDVWDFLRVDWCKKSSLAPYALRQQR
uniref:Uncharacterized protein n=1 Tax=Globisporangium ultimum (strain ATCC 200006 / CBS 805.95 / DAOM BR144) TaxID=431595 RepID=K3WJH1_GLOUD